MPINLLDGDWVKKSHVIPLCNHQEQKKSRYKLQKTLVIKLKLNCNKNKQGLTFLFEVKTCLTIYFTNHRQ